jgi:hypothetical protein
MLRIFNSFHFFFLNSFLKLNFFCPTRLGYPRLLLLFFEFAEGLAVDKDEDLAAFSVE